MKSFITISILSCIVFIQCGSNSSAEDPSEICLNLQAILNDATDQKLETLEAYTKDPDNSVVCENYVVALDNRIESAQNLVDAGCLSAGALIMTEAAIMEDKEERSRLAC